jgi:hypothetical protein
MMIMNVSLREMYKLKCILYGDEHQLLVAF